MCPVSDCTQSQVPISGNGTGLKCVVEIMQVRFCICVHSATVQEVNFQHQAMVLG